MKKRQRKAFKRMLFGPVIAIVGLPVMFYMMPQCGGAQSVAIDAINRCASARAALGDNVRQAYVGLACGRTKTGGDWGVASWRVSVTGSKGGGRLDWAARMRDGKWRLRRARLTVDGKEIDVLACAGGATPGGGGASGARKAREIKLTWRAEVGDARGRDLTSADSCWIKAGFASNGKWLASRLTVVCKRGRPLYQGNSGRGLRCQLFESPAPERDNYRYAIKCKDKGKRSGKELFVDTQNKTASVRSKDGKLSVAFKVPKVFVTRTGQPLMPANEPSGKSFPVVQRAGKVSKVTGDAPVASGASCSLTLKSTGRRGLGCHLAVRCDGKAAGDAAGSAAGSAKGSAKGSAAGGQIALYGKPPAGFMRCAIVDSKPPDTLRDDRGTPEDKDPRVSVDLAKGRVVVSDDVAGKSYRVEISLDK